jgi:glycosyltransferase involved in cell wall biosynthesis
MKEGYIEQSKRKKILLLCDDIRMTSGISTMAREMVIGTAHHFNWVNVGGAINHPDQGKRFDINGDTNTHAGISDASVYLYPINGYGDPTFLKQMIAMEKPDALMMFTDPRYWIWLFQMEHEIRKKMPIIYLNIWDDLPYPMYNKPYYESCDALLAISKQTENLNRAVLGPELSAEKVIKYVPHGINESIFFPITTEHTEYLSLQEFKKQLYGNKSYDFTVLYNARNIRRKSVPDLMLAWKIFVDNLPEDKAKKCALVLHTQIADENGTDLQAVKDMIFGYDEKYNVIFDQNKYPANMMNLLYNATDVNALISSNEGWGLSLTEAMMCGKPIIATVTGGMQDQMRFENEKGEWIKFTEEFGSNHRGKYKKHGKWAFPVFPSNLSIVGSIPTPYIFDDRAEPFDIAEQIQEVYALKTNQVEEYGSHTRGFETYEEICKAARAWVTSDESMQSARWMCKNIIDGIDETFANWQPRHSFELIQVETPKQPKHYNKYVIAK